MSKNSIKANYTQLVTWLETKKPVTASKVVSKNESRLSYYDKKGNNGRSNRR